MHHSRRAIFTLLAVAAAVAASAPVSSSTTNASSPVRIAFFLGSLANNYQRAQLTGLQKGAKEYGGVVAKVFDSKGQRRIQT